MTLDEYYAHFDAAFASVEAPKMVGDIRGEYWPRPVGVCNLCNHMLLAVGHQIKCSKCGGIAEQIIMKPNKAGSDWKQYLFSLLPPEPPKTPEQIAWSKSHNSISKLK